MAEVERALAGKHARAPAVLRWIVRSNRSYVVALPTPKRLRKLGECKQFVMLSAAPERQARFEEEEDNLSFGSIDGFDAAAAA